MKKLKILFLAGLALLSTLSIFALNACDKSEPPKETITIVEAYPEMEGNPFSITVRINDHYEGTFVIDDSAQILEIMRILKNRIYTLQDSSEPIPPLTNRTMKFEFDGAEGIGISTLRVSFEGNLYACKYDGLDARLEQIGLEKEALTKR